MPVDARQTALDILSELERRDVPLDQLMDDFHAHTILEDRDIRLVQALIYGVLRWRSRLDWHINALGRKAPEKIDPLVRNVLRLGLFQILFMDRIPHSAAVNTAVSMIKSSGKIWAAGFVNALLRRVIRERGAVASAPPALDPVKTLALDQSIPSWLAARWIARWGPAEAKVLCQSVNQIPPLSIRTNLLKTTRDRLAETLQGFAAGVALSTFTPEGIRLQGLKGRLFDSGAFRAGEFQVQDEAAQAVGHLLAPEPGDRLLDACAGQGGKTAHLAELMHNSGCITAVDRSSGKLKRLEEEMQRLGLGIVKTVPYDWHETSALQDLGTYDRVLIDAPCSGLGVLRRNPDTKWKRTPDSLVEFQRMQLTLLDRIAGRLRPGGVLVYAVCSTEPEETQAVIQPFLNKHREFAIDDQPPQRTRAIAGLLTAGGWLHTEPHRHGTDGFFAVRLKRSAG